MKLCATHGTYDCLECPHGLTTKRDNIQVVVSHTTSTDALSDITMAYGSHEITSETAVTIASWWQAPAGIGNVLASFASGCVVDRRALLDDIDATRRVEGYYSNMPEWDKRALDLLSTFVINYGRNDK